MDLLRKAARAHLQTSEFRQKLDTLETHEPLQLLSSQVTQVFDLTSW